METPKIRKKNNKKGCKDELTSNKENAQYVDTPTRNSREIRIQLNVARANKDKNKKNISASVERRNEQNKDRVRKFREKMTAEELDEKRRKDRERYKRKKDAGLIKTIDQCSSSERKTKRKNWAKSSSKYRQRLKDKILVTQFLEASTPPQSDNENYAPDILEAMIPTPSSSKKLSGRKRVKRNRSMAYRKLRKIEAENVELRNKVEKYKKRFYRLKARNSKTSDSPESKVQRMTKGLNVPKEIKRRLLFGEALAAELHQNVKTLIGDKNKQIARKFVSGNIIKRYRLVKETNGIVSYKMHRKNRNNLKLNQYERKKRNIKLTIILRNEIQTFLERDEYSRMCPGKKDFVRKGKNAKQKRLLLYSLKQLHKTFTSQKEKYISYATFLRHKSFWIVAPRNSDRETCACVKHANINLIVNKLHSKRLINSSHVNNIIKTVVCSNRNKTCMFRECSICKSSRYNISKDKENELQNTITFYQWETISEEKMIKDKMQTIKRTTKVEKEETIKDLFKRLNMQIVSFQKHCFVMFHQMQQIQKQKEFLNDNTILIQIDFSENYVAKYSKEIQAMHFGASKRQISLHTGLYYVRDAETGLVKNRCFCTVSDNLDHQPHAVWVHLEHVLKKLSTEYPNTDTVNFFSDGPSSQYRNRFNLYLFKQKLPLFFKNLKNASWNYSESGHGKGPMDGVGGSLKRKADGLVLRGEDITSAFDFVCKLQGTSIELWEVLDAEIKDVKSRLPERISSVPSIMSVHQVTWNKTNPNELQLRLMSCFSCTYKEKCHHYSLKPSAVQLNVNTKQNHCKTAVVKQTTENIRAPTSHRQQKSSSLVHTINELDSRVGDKVQQMKNKVVVISKITTWK